ncbi:family B DNA-directed DNA polymerase [Natronorubrum bangense JCM 10635]|uniref:Family B DNA-directed DNA polymerase n=1 Tax=Natronorubrum bangense JCM 10635 TaxID=1227500 RepID=L9WKT7_9EURY|nr:family B DNA-directed DNA polymerase [Natronorubrum bangense JCM 10635]
MVKLYVTNVTAAWNEKRNEQTIRLHGRAADRGYESIEIFGFSPHFYAPTHEIEKLGRTLFTHQEVTGVEESGYESLFGDELGRIEVRNHWDVNEVASLFDETFQTDPYLTNTARVEWGLFTGVEAPAYEVHYSELESVDFTVPTRVMTFDIETDDRGEFPELGERAILSIVAHDSYTDETIAFVDLAGWVAP